MASSRWHTLSHLHRGCSVCSDTWSVITHRTCLPDAKQLSSGRTFLSLQLHPWSSLFLHIEGTKMECFPADLPDATVHEFLLLWGMLVKASPGPWRSSASHVEYHPPWPSGMLSDTAPLSGNRLNNSVFVCTHKCSQSVLRIYRRENALIFFFF